MKPSKQLRKAIAILYLIFLLCLLVAVIWYAIIPCLLGLWRQPLMIPPTLLMFYVCWRNGILHKFAGIKRKSKIEPPSPPL
jgi:hypothetical protein